MWDFDWDEGNRIHVAAHGVSRQEAEQVIRNGPLDLDIQIEDGKERFLQIGETAARRILIVVSVWRGIAIRVVTAFDAPKAMKHHYIATKGSDYGADTDNS